MFMRFLTGLVLLLTLFISRPVAAQSPYFGEYINYQRFVELPRTEQRKFLVSLMRTLADMEQAAIESNKLEPMGPTKKTVQQIRWEKAKQALEKLTQLIAIAPAYADSEPKYCPNFNKFYNARDKDQDATCIFGSYKSTFIVVPGSNNGQGFCQRPACSIDPEFRRAYEEDAAAGGCSATEFSCNPVLYGVNSQGNKKDKPTCVEMDFKDASGSFRNHARNASLACMMAVVNDPSKVTRLDAIVKKLEDPSFASEFNEILKVITNLCLCGPGAVDSVMKKFSAEYGARIQDHRTCYALLAQTRFVLDAAPSSISCENKPFPTNIVTLFNELGFIRDYANTVSGLIGTSSVKAWFRNYSSDDSPAIDDTYTQKLQDIRDKNAANVCKLDFDDPIPPAGPGVPVEPATAAAPPACEIKFDQSKIKFNGDSAEVTFGFKKLGEQWGDAELPAEVKPFLGNSFLGKATVTRDDNKITLKSANNEELTCTSEEIKFPEACVISFGEITPGAGGKIKFTASIPDTVQDKKVTKVQWVKEENSSETTSADFEITKPAGDIELTALATLEGVTEPVSCAGVNNNGPTDAGAGTPADQTADKATCEVAANAVQVNDFLAKVTATVTAKAKVKDKTTVKFDSTGVAFTVNGSTATSDVDISVLRKPIKISASFTGDDGKAYQCESKDVSLEQNNMGQNFNPMGQPQFMPMPKPGGSILIDHGSVNRN